MDLRTDLPVVGMVGGGQLARMSHQAAVSLGQSLRVLASDEHDSAALVNRDVHYGQHTDLEALRAFAKGTDVVTFDHEHVPPEHLRTLVNDGYVLRPGPEALEHAQDKLRMRECLSGHAVPGPPFAGVADVSDVLAFAADQGWPVVLKAARGGYDGRGVWVLESGDQARALVPGMLDSGTPLLVESKVDLRRELTALIARSPFGQGAVWPVVEMVQQDGINTEVLAPAPGLSPSLMHKAQTIALRIADVLDVVGILAVELFETDSGLLVNELAMRPHNSGHWTMDGSGTSQFEQHLRAVLDYPLGTTELRSETVMTNVLGADTQPTMRVDERIHHLFARFPDVRLHWYGKQERPGRKLGHINLLGDITADSRERARLAAHWLSHAEWFDGYTLP